MNSPLRAVVAFFGVVTAYAALAFYFRWPMVEDIWPWSGYDARLSPLSFYFISSIAAAISAPLIWLAVTNRMRAAAGGAFNLILTFSGVSVFMLQGYLAERSNTRLLAGAILFAASVVFTFLIYLRVRKLPFEDRRPLPRPVSISFIIYIIALILVGGALVLKTPNIMPWSLSEEASVVYGWVFLGAACYFIYSLRYPVWENAVGQLLGFLAYDVVLIVPFIREFAVVRPELRINLIIYTTVVVHSGALAVFYCFINPSTRLRRRAARA